MKMYIGYFTITLLISTASIAQNVGIGTNSPAHPLSFSNNLGSKISLYGGAGSHYGFGIQGGLLQMYSDAAAADIAFGYGSSSSFTERMRLYNGGPDVLLAKGRIILQNGTTPPQQAYAPGIWLGRADATGNLGFMGTQNNQNIGFFGGPAGWGFTYDAINSRVGIGNPNPNAPLAFPALLGKKITLYPGGLGNVGLGVYANELRIHTDYEPADITFGFENSAGIFTERMRVKGNGGIALQQNTGNAGQVITSNGPGQPASWSDKPSVQYFDQTSVLHLTGALLSAPLPGLNGQPITINQTSRLVFTTVLNLYPNVFGSPRTDAKTEIRNSQGQVVGRSNNAFQFHDYIGQTVNFQGITNVIPPGTYYIYSQIARFNSIDGELTSASSSYCNCQGGQVIVQIFPQ